MDPKEDMPKRKASLNDSQPNWVKRFIKENPEFSHLKEPVTKWQAPTNKKGRR